jgi:hypothetical protein
MTLLVDAGARTVVAGEGAGEGTVRQHGPFPRTWPAPSERSRTLDDVLSGAWEGLSAAAPFTACPVCQGELVPRWSAGAGVVGGRCADCGSELS